MNVTLTEDEKKDDTRGAKRILNELFNRAVENAEKVNKKSNITATDKEYIKPAVLLILDNVDHPELIQPPCSDIISGKEWLKILVTTRLGPEELGEDETTQKLLSIDELPFEDGVSLIESYQPGGRFKNEEEKEKAGEIVKLLGGFTLAVEVAALYLYEKKGRVSCAEFFEVLKSKGVDYAGEHTTKQLSHTKLISATLTPTLDSLSPEETLIMSYASLLPPDSIPLPWLKVLVVKEYPQLGEEEMAGIDNPWISTINQLLSLRLLQVVGLDGQMPRLVRMHRLISEIVRNRQKEIIQKFRDDLTDSIKIRCNDLENTWHQHQWEVLPIVGYTKSLLEINDHKVPSLVRSLCQWLTAWDKGLYSEPILHATIKFLELNPSSDIKDLSVSLSNLGWALNDLGRYQEAEKYLRQALEIDENTINQDKQALVIRYTNLSQCLRGQGKYAESRSLIKKALEVAVLEHGNNHRITAICIATLASVELSLGNLKEAKELILKTIAIEEKIYENYHPDLAISYNNLAMIEHELGNYMSARSYFRLSLDIRKNTYGENHPSTANGHASLARLLADMREDEEAENHAKKAISIWKQSELKNDSRLGKAYWALGIIDIHRKNEISAMMHFNKALHLLRLGNGEDHPWVSSIKNEINKIQHH